MALWNSKTYLVWQKGASVRRDVQSSQVSVPHTGGEMGARRGHS